MRALTLFLLLASGLAASGARAQDPTPGDLTFYDRFEGAVRPIDQHAPTLDEAGTGWRIDGTGAAPIVLSSSILFETGSQAAAIADAPGGDRTITYTARQPAGHTSDVTTYAFVRYLDAQNYVALRVRWGPAPVFGQSGPDAVVTLDRVEGGALVTRLPYPGIPHSGYERPLRVDVETDGPAVTVWTDGERLGTVQETTLAAATAFGFASDGPPRQNGGSHGRIFDVAVTTPTALPTTVCPDLRGWNAESCIRDAYGPLATRDYDEARDELFTWVWATHGSGFERTVEAIYGGAVSTWRHDYALSPREQVQDDGFNTEHVWPRSRGAQPGQSTDHPAHNDLHHLAPVWGTFNSARSNRAFGDDFDNPGDTHKWLRGRTTRYASSGTPTDVTEYSRVERDFLRQPDNGDGWKELDELGRFDVRHDRRGDVARAAAYFLVLYRIEAEDGGAGSGSGEGRDFIEATLDVLLDWHEADPVDAAERLRNERIYRVQGNRNPFVLDASLLRRALYQGPNSPRARDLWINEIHHSNDGEDTGEGVEIAGRAGTDLYGYRVWVYSGYGDLYQIDGDGADRSPAIAFRGELDEEGGGIGAVWATAEGLRGGCQGLALTDPDNVLIEFVSYGGCEFNALAGPVYDAALAAGAGDISHPDSLVWSTGVRGARPSPGAPPRRVQEWSGLPIGYAIQLTGSGDRREDFHWGGPYPATPGRLNDYQAPATGPGGTSSANRTSGWGAGDAVPLGLLAPATDTGHDEDRPAHDALTLGDSERSYSELAVSPPSPNPSRTSTHLHVAVPTDARAEAVVYDALGRAVAHHDDVAGRLRIDVSGLAAGVYVVRVAASGVGAPGPTITHRFTVVR